MREMNLTVQEFLDLKWKMLSPDPILNPPRFSPVIADPTVVTPEKSPDGAWHLFSHSVFGIHHYTSKTPEKWEGGKLIKRHGMRPFVLFHEGKYYLYYERYRNFQILFSWISFWPWKSRIEVMSSEDLVHWSNPVTVLEPHLDWHMDSPYGKSVSNPCVLFQDGEFLMYYSASLRLVPDCGFCEPAHISLARSKNPLGPFESSPKPLLSPDSRHSWMNLGAGAMKVLKLKDGYVGMQNGIYEDKEGKSGSAIYALPSTDGKNWNLESARQILIPNPDIPWMGSHVYALDCRFHTTEQRWYLFFNGRDEAHWTKGHEVLGALYSDL